MSQKWYVAALHVSWDLTSVRCELYKSFGMAWHGTLWHGAVFSRGTNMLHFCVFLASPVSSESTLDLCFASPEEIPE